MKTITCPCCHKKTLEVSRNATCGGVTAWCSNCGFLDSTSHD